MRNIFCSNPKGHNDKAKVKFYVSNNGGKNWQIKEVPVISDIGFYKTSCSGTAKQAICNITGFDKSGYYGFIATSLDSGQTWTDFSNIITSPFGHLLLNNTSCTGTGKSAVCVAVGSVTIGSTSEPFLAITEEGGKRWVLKNIKSSNLKKTVLNSASCTGEGIAAVCVLVGEGYTYSGERRAIIVVNTNGDMTTWEYKDIPPLLIPGSSPRFLTVSCTGTGENIICVAAGFFMNTGNEEQPLLAISTDRANTWTEKYIGNIYATLYSSACRGNGQNANCVVGGRTGLGKHASPFIVTINNGGLSLATKLHGLPLGDTAL